jgi:hypothetical protein
MNRNTNDPTYRTNDNGFRLALVPLEWVTTGWWWMHLSFSTEQIVFLSEQAEA